MTVARPGSSQSQEPIEVVSDEPEHQSADHVDKVRIYERAQVAEYFILDPPSHRRTAAA